MSFNRRRLLTAAGGLAALALTSRRPLGAIAQTKFGAYPFSLGVASGDPDATSVVLWTRLAPEPLAPAGGLPPADIPVRWQVATEPQMRQVVARGETLAIAGFAHAVHVLATGLEPDRPYWYQFAVGNAASSEVSPVGRTRTLPAPDASPARLDFAFVSCQNYEHGYFTALGHIAREDLNFVLHLGDYIYEYPYRADEDVPRRHPEFAAADLTTYRHRYALYRQDRDLQAVHAAHPFICTWDDHEVDNDYAGAIAANFADVRTFLQQRAAAYQAYYEHLPLRVVARQPGQFSNLELYRRFDFGDLARFHVLDTRQYRSNHVCGPDPAKGGGQVVDMACPRLQDPTRTMLGAFQETWLFSGLDASRAHWNVLAQQYLVSHVRRPQPGGGAAVWNEGWDGYPVSRQRLLNFLARREPRNPIFIGGDIHSFWASDLKQDFEVAGSPIVASEFVTTSVSANGIAYDYIAPVLPANPHVKFFESRLRGYTRCTVDRDRWQSDLKTVATVREPESALSLLATYGVLSDRKGVERL